MDDSKEANCYPGPVPQGQQGDLLVKRQDNFYSANPRQDHQLHKRREAFQIEPSSNKLASLRPLRPRYPSREETLFLILIDIYHNPSQYLGLYSLYSYGKHLQWSETIRKYRDQSIEPQLLRYHVESLRVLHQRV